MTKEQLLDDLVGKLREDLGDELVCVVLYGSAVTGDYQEKVSDLNVLCVLETIGPAQLEKAYPAVDRWLKRKQPPPIFLSTEEVENAHDAFAIEFRDIRVAYRVLHGEDVVASIEVEPVHHRYQVEHELRSMLLRLRERYLALQKDHREVTRLMVDSLSTFSTLFRHALILRDCHRTSDSIYRYLRQDLVVPFSMEGIAFNVECGDLFIGDLEAGRVEV